MNVDSASEILESSYGTKLAGQPSSIFTASGPFTLDADLDFAPFDALVEEIKRSRPDVVILVRFSLPQSPSLELRRSLDISFAFLRCALLRWARSSHPPTR